VERSAGVGRGRRALLARTATLCGTSKHVADRLGELRDAGVHHVLCQMSYGYLSQAAIMGSMRRFGEDVIPRFR